jgi:hypothetical protein
MQRSTQFADLTIPRCWESLAHIFSGKAYSVSDGILSKVVVTIIVCIGFAVWLSSDREERPGCGVHCPTDFSANRR